MKQLSIYVYILPINVELDNPMNLSLIDADRVKKSDVIAIVHSTTKKFKLYRNKLLIEKAVTTKALNIGISELVNYMVNE